MGPVKPSEGNFNDTTKYSTQEAVMHHRSILWQTRNKTQPFDHKNVVYPILLQTATDLWNACRAKGSSCAGEQGGSMHQKGVTLALLQGTALSPGSLNTWCAHSKVRAPLQEHRFIFCSLFLPGIGQQISWPQLRGSKIREAPWHQGCRTRKQSPVPSNSSQEWCLPPSATPCPVSHGPSVCSAAAANLCPRASGAASFRKMKIIHLNILWYDILIIHLTILWLYDVKIINLNIFLICSQQWTAGPGWAGIFPALLILSVFLFLPWPSCKPQARLV